MDFTNIAIVVMVLVVSIVGHEIMHGYVAYKFGDSTAKEQNRLNINPIHHIDIVGTIIVPTMLYLVGGVIFGWAKPVPVNMRIVYQNGGYKAMIAVALAGISYNLALSACAYFTLVFMISSPELLYFAPTIAQILLKIFSINLILALFNLYPLPQLDGAKALQYALAWFGFKNISIKLASLDKYAFVILILIVVSPIGKIIFMPILKLVSYLVGLLYAI